MTIYNCFFPENDPQLQKGHSSQSRTRQKKKFKNLKLGEFLKVGEIEIKL